MSANDNTPRWYPGSTPVVVGGLASLILAAKASTHAAGVPRPPRSIVTTAGAAEGK